MRILALDIGGMAIKSALFDGDCLVRHEETPSDGKRGGDAVVRTALQIIRSYGEFDRLGISTAGQVSRTDGTIVFANDNIPGYTGTDLREILERETGRPACILNDVNAAALGEATHGAGRGCRDFICLTIGTGIGGGIFLNGGLYTGTDGLAGELGHMVTHPGGRQCVCGQCGCYEQYASTGALIRVAKQIRPGIQNGRDFFEELYKDPGLLGMFDTWIQELLIGLVTLTHIFNPARFVMGGGIMSQRIIIDALQEGLYARIMPSYRKVEVLGAQLSNLAGVYGAMAAAKQI